MMGEIYERELKNLLCGDEKALHKMTRTGDADEKNGYMLLKDNPFLVIRAAGSLGVDIVALRWDFSFPIEVKSSQTDVLRFSSNPRLSEQADRMAEDCSRSCLIPMYAFRLKGFKGDPWRVFSLPMERELEGRMGMLQRRIPPIERNQNGNYIMRWQDGLKLSKLLSYLDYVSGTLE
ncbi:MAG: Holliday junction resolvase [Candidatus Methanomethylophilaceae archaeon]|nr:Holliday junction resolvase [Candidatus Methanomethylophilaceae archaeon]